MFVLLIVPKTAVQGERHCFCFRVETDLICTHQQDDIFMLCSLCYDTLVRGGINLTGYIWTTISSRQWFSIQTDAECEAPTQKITIKRHFPTGLLTIKINHLKEIHFNAQFFLPSHLLSTSVFSVTRVLFISIHRYECRKFWPKLREGDFDFIGDGSGRGFNINIPLNKVSYLLYYQQIEGPLRIEFLNMVFYLQTGMTDSDYLAIFHTLIMPIAYEVRLTLTFFESLYPN